jgi:hypothetical protein
VKKNAKADREKYIREICCEIENARMKNKTRAVDEGIRKITGKHAPEVRSVKDKMGKIVTEPEEVKAQWREYFDKLYNDPNSVDEDYLDNFPEARNTESIPSVGEDEVRAAIARMKVKKAPGIDNITAEELAAASQGSGLRIPHRLCRLIWNNEQDMHELLSRQHHQ